MTLRSLTWGCRWKCRWTQPFSTRCGPNMVHGKARTCGGVHAPVLAAAHTFNGSRNFTRATCAALCCNTCRNPFALSSLAPRLADGSLAGFLSDAVVVVCLCRSLSPPRPLNFQPVIRTTLAPADPFMYLCTPGLPGHPHQAAGVNMECEEARPALPRQCITARMAACARPQPVLRGSAARVPPTQNRQVSKRLRLPSARSKAPDLRFRLVAVHDSLLLLVIKIGGFDFRNHKAPVHQTTSNRPLRQGSASSGLLPVPVSLGGARKVRRCLARRVPAL